MHGAEPAPADASFLLAYLAPLREALNDPVTIEVVMNPDGLPWVERHGVTHMAPLEGVRFDSARLRDLARAIAGETRGQISARRPIVSGKIALPDGRPVRAQVVHEPAVEAGAAIALRRYREERVGLDAFGLLHGELVDLARSRRDRAGEVAEMMGRSDVAGAMRRCVEDRLNVLVSGGTTTGKTTFARGLLDLIPAGERIVTIEDAFELFPAQPNRVMLLAERDEASARSAARLLEASLRLRPDRIVLGELRGAECVTFLEAINTGHAGSVTTVHADTATKAIDRLALMVMGTGIAMTYADVRRYCAASIDVVVQLGRRDGRRGVEEVMVAGAVA
jgi:type IV secretion system protein VirB11